MCIILRALSCVRHALHGWGNHTPVALFKCLSDMVVRSHTRFVRHVLTHPFAHNDAQIANLANVSALVYHAFKERSDAKNDANWVGFYLNREGNKLVLGPFQGKIACVRIPFGKGVCGDAAKAGHTLLVPDVHAYPGHIACDSASNSEIVVPLKDENGVCSYVPPRLPA